MSEETFTFQAEVSKLLDIVAHALYSHKEIFLRELVSNAADACDRLRYEALTRPGLAAGDLRITLTPEPKKRTLTIADNGIGMNRDELVENLGTIARSGTQAFVEAMAANQKGAGKGKPGEAAPALIGQFGVGFYSAFMVADRVEVISRRAGDRQAWRWESDGKGAFTLGEAERDGAGTAVILHLTKDAKEFLEPARIRTIVKTYSDHVDVPIVLEADGGGETLNAASALWMRPAKDIASEQYTEFYRHVAHAGDEPWKVLHNRIEGVLSYTNLLFIPASRPWDLFDPARKTPVKLYVKRVFITDDCEALLPPYLRFVRGIVDSEDLSLNVSREMLQHDPKLAKIRQGLVKRILNELKKAAEKKPDDYVPFWENFGAVLKEGLYEDPAQRAAILPLARFRSTKAEGWRSLAEYKAGMKEGQEAIYTITGEDVDALRTSPQIEGFRARGIEVLLLSDSIDEFWPASVGDFEGTPFRSVTKGAADLGKIVPEKDGGEDKANQAPAVDGADLGILIAALKQALGEGVGDVRASERLTESAVCLVADEGALDLRLERLLKAHKQLGAGELVPRILEINPRHAVIRRLAAAVAAKGAEAPEIGDAAHLLLDQARLIEGEPLQDPAAFARRFAAMLEKGLAV